MRFIYQITRGNNSWKKSFINHGKKLGKQSLSWTIKVQSKSHNPETMLLTRSTSISNIEGMSINHQFREPVIRITHSACWFQRRNLIFLNLIDNLGSVWYWLIHKLQIWYLRLMNHLLWVLWETLSIRHWSFYSLSINENHWWMKRSSFKALILFLKSQEWSVWNLFKRMKPYWTNYNCHIKYSSFTFN